jgi:hypothetical protein
MPTATDEQKKITSKLFFYFKYHIVKLPLNLFAKIIEILSWQRKLEHTKA